MAGVTDYPFRSLCRDHGARITISEMVTVRPLVEGNAKTLRLATFGPDESPRSLQLYGTDPEYVGRAVERLVGEGRVDHIDMNFGCPVRKVTAAGGGATLPARPRLLAAIVRAAVSHAGAVPVTIKFRLGIDDPRLTFLETGRIAEAEGCAAVGLHARTAAQLYSGRACWASIAQLKQMLSIPVLGNGDVWESGDALRMMRTTGCDGVIVGRGCLGRPWLFREIAQAFSGHSPDPAPCLGEVADLMQTHAARLIAWSGEARAMRAFRRHATWYTKGFRRSAELRERLTHLETFAELDRILDAVDRSEPFPVSVTRVPRGKSGGSQRVSLPPGFLEDEDEDEAILAKASSASSPSDG
jgi:nifR3 family TIM-barrel protein